MLTTLLDKEPVVVSQETPVSLLEVYHDAIIEYGVRYGRQRVSGLLIKHVPHEQLTYGRLGEGAVIIYTLKNSEHRLLMPSPNVRFAPLTMHHLYDVHKFSSMQKALSHPQIINELAEVSLDIYINLWRAVGANIGRKIGGVICWEKSFLRNFRTQCLH